MARHVLGPLAEFPTGSKRRIQVGRRAIAVFNAGGRLYALRDTCPHQGAPLSSGVVLSQVRATAPGEYDYHPECKFVRCPWHGWEYNLETGESSYDPAHDRVRAYEVSVEPGAALDAGGGRVTGPYAAETVAISVEHDYVVVEV